MKGSGYVSLQNHAQIPMGALQTSLATSGSAPAVPPQSLDITTTMNKLLKTDDISAMQSETKKTAKRKGRLPAANDAYFTRLGGLPKQMLEAPRWLVWKRGCSKTDGSWAKLPYYVSGRPRGEGGELDSPEDLAQLASFDEAWAALQKGRYDGLGFALGADANGGYWQGIDLDHIAAQGISFLQDELPGYVEISPSGEGAHAIGYGVCFPTLSANDTGIEVYARRRFFTVTGNCVRREVGALPDLADYVVGRLAPLHESRKLVHRDADTQIHSNSGNTETQAREEGCLARFIGPAAANDAPAPSFSPDSLPSNCIPSGPGQRNQILFKLARHLKSHFPSLGGVELLPYVRCWHGHFLDVIGTKEWFVTEEDFLYAHERVRVLVGEGALESLMEQVSADRLPSDTLQKLGVDGRCWALVQLCYHAAQRSPDRTFFLSARYAGQLCRMSHASASSVLRNLVRKGMLEEVAKGILVTRMASEYRWIWPCPIYASDEEATPTQRPAVPQT